MSGMNFFCPAQYTAFLGAISAAFITFLGPLGHAAQHYSAAHAVMERAAIKGASFKKTKSILVIVGGFLSSK